MTTIHQQIYELQRELRMRRKVYPDWTVDRPGRPAKLKPETAAHRIECLEDVIQKLEAERDATSPLLFPSDPLKHRDDG